MDALILAAGEGTRLRPLTYTKPKPLLPILNRPLLQWTLEYLSRFSINRAILNTHHLADQIDTYIRSLKKSGFHELSTRYESLILNTGGGLVNTRDFFRSDPFMVISGDILTDIDLKKVVDFHQSHNDPVTLVLHDYPEFNQIKVDSNGRIVKLRKGDAHGLDFANIHILDQAVFNFLPSSGSFDITSAYQQMIDEGITIRAYVSQGHYWRNIGTPTSYLKAHEELLSTPSLTLPPLETESQLTKTSFRRSSPEVDEIRNPGNINGIKRHLDPGSRPPSGLGRDNDLQHSLLSGRAKEGILIHPEARIEEGIEFSGWACIGKGCLLKKGCLIHNSVIWEDATVESGASVSESILGQGVHLKNDLHSGVMI
jgi:NDP-sugar pyrophosphorylase family protein